MIRFGSHSGNGCGPLGSCAARQARSTSLVEYALDDPLAERADAFGIELGLDLRHREPVVPEGQDALALRGADLFGWTPAGIGRQEYVCDGIFVSAEVADHGVNRSGSDLEAAREGLGANSIDKVGAQDLVTDMVGMGGPGEEVGEVWAWHGDPSF